MKAITDSKVGLIVVLAAGLGLSTCSPIGQLSYPSDTADFLRMHRDKVLVYYQGNPGDPFGVVYELRDNGRHIPYPERYDLSCRFNPDGWEAAGSRLSDELINQALREPVNGDGKRLGFTWSDDGKVLGFHYTVPKAEHEQGGITYSVKTPCKSQGQYVFNAVTQTSAR